MAKKPRSTKRGIDKVARAVTKAVGGRDFARYIGQSIAKKKNSNVKKTVTKKQAFKSGAKIGLAIATLGSGAAGTRAYKATKRKSTAKVHNGSNAQIKRTYSGHEKAARRTAKRKKK